MRRLALAEHRTERGVRLTRAEREGLEEAIPELGMAPARGGPAGQAGAGRFDVTPGSWVGVAQVTRELVVEIAPKLEVSRVLFLLSHARDARAWRVGAPAALEGRPDLVETVVGLFCGEVRRGLRFGVLQGYRRREEALLTLRGRLRMEEQVRRRPGQSVPAECAYDELTPDIPENRVIKAALARAARLPGGAGATAARRLMPAFMGVSDEGPEAGGTPSIAITRLTERLRPALELARLILGEAGLEARTGGVRAPSILFDMDRIFEEFVAAALRDSLGLSSGSFTQGAVGGGRRLSLDRAGRLALEPDLAWWEGGRCVFVGDVKYKRTTRGEHADLYQLLAYTTAADLPGGLLVYAAGDEPESAPRLHEVRHAGKTLHVATLDLTAEPGALLAQIDRIGGLVRRLKAGAAGRDAA